MRRHKPAPEVVILKSFIYLQVTALLDKVKLLLISTQCIIGLDFILV
jgi:hypothetical protein